MTRKTSLALATALTLSAFADHHAFAQPPKPGATRSPRGRIYAPTPNYDFGMEAERRRLNAEIRSVNSEQSRLSQRAASLRAMDAQIESERQALVNIRMQIRPTEDKEVLERILGRARSFSISRDRCNEMIQSYNYDYRSWLSRGQNLDRDIAAFKAKYRSSGSSGSGLIYDENATRSSRPRR
jgi:hypothetical protein